MSNAIKNGSLIINGEVIPPSQANVLIALNLTFGWVEIHEISKRLKEPKSYNIIYVLLNRLKLKGIVLYKSIPRTPKKVIGYWMLDQSVKDQLKEQQLKADEVVVSKEFVDQAGQAMAFLKQIKLMHLSMVNTLNDLDRRNYSGLLLDDDVINAMEVIFPNDSCLLTKPESVIDNFVFVLITRLKRYQQVKELFASSGAMRYPWSQEARMTSLNFPSFKVD